MATSEREYYSRAFWLSIGCRSTGSHILRQPRLYMFGALRNDYISVFSFDNIPSQACLRENPPSYFYYLPLTWGTLW